METLVLENKYKIVVPLFGAAYARPSPVRQAPDHFFLRSMLSVVSLFSHFGSFYILPLILLNLPQFIDAIINNPRLRVSSID